MIDRNHKLQIENVVGRFWVDREDPEVSMGYIDLGVFGRIKNVKLFRSRKRHGKENIDSDYTLVVRAVDTPIGLMRFCREMIEKAIWEDVDENEAVGAAVVAERSPGVKSATPALATAPGPIPDTDKGLPGASVAPHAGAWIETGDDDSNELP